MTTLAPNKPVRQQTATLHRGVLLVVELHAGYLTLRVKKERSFVAVDYGAIYDLGQKLAARQIPTIRRKA